MVIECFPVLVGSRLINIGGRQRTDACCGLRSVMPEVAPTGRPLASGERADGVRTMSHDLESVAVSQRRRFAACVGMCPRPYPASCFCQAARRIGWPPPTWTQSTDCPGPNRGGSASRMGALQDHALEAWHGRDENLGAGRRALYQRAAATARPA